MPFGCTKPAPVIYLRQLWAAHLSCPKLSAQSEGQDQGPRGSDRRGGLFRRDTGGQIPRLIEISAWLRKEREFAFCGDIDFIPTERYSQPDALAALADARLVVSLAEQVII